MESGAEEFPFRIYEENIIEIEVDSQTQTDDLGPKDSAGHSNNAVRKQISENATLNRKSRKSKVFDYVYKRELGCKLGSNVTLDVSAIEKQQLSPKSYFLTTHNELDILECEYIRPGLDGQSVIGFWTGNQFDYIMYRLQFKLNSRCSRKNDEEPKAITSIERQGPYFAQTHLTDICDTYIGGQNYLLYVGSKFADNWRLNCSVVCTFASTSPTNGKQYISSRELICCAGCQNRNIFAVGTNEGVLFYRDEICNFNGDYQDRINSVEFDRSGNLLFCGCDSASVIVYDLRDHGHICYNFPIRSLCEAGIIDTKLLSDETKLIVSEKDGSLSKIDLRTKSTLIKYPGGSRRKISFTVNESTNLLCATGTDNVTRLWSLNTGEQLHSINPHMLHTDTYSTLICSGLRWAVALFQKNKMYVMEPWA